MYSSILLPLDLDEPSSWAKALPTALALARCFDSRFTLGTVVTDRVAMREAEWSAIGFARLIDEAAARLGLFAGERVCDHPVQTRVGTGSVGRGIVSLADEVKADLIVMASHRPAMRDRLIGANAAHVSRHAACSVMIVRE